MPPSVTSCNECLGKAQLATHTYDDACAVGGIVGFSLVYGGADAVIWWERKADFPYVGGMVPIVLSWVISPVLACLMAFLLFVITRFLVLRRKNSTKIAYWVS
jgi:sodium-dependent phosphate transporter